MVELSTELRLVQKSISTQGSRVTPNESYRDDVTGGDVPSGVDRGYAAPPELSLDLISAVEDRRGRQGLGHRSVA
jgi:hypothetical protein